MTPTTNGPGARWRVVSDGGYARYLSVCPRCHQRTGWRSEALAQSHIADLAKMGWGRPDRMHAVTYEPGDGGTCAGHDEVKQEE